MNVSVSVTDLPLFLRFEKLFAGLKEAGADGVEVVTGFRSRWSWEQLKKLSEKHDLPITSVHQSPWSFLNLYFDEIAIQRAADIGVKTFVFHPLPRYSFSDRTMVSYLKKLAYLQDRYGIKVLLENMPSVVRRKFAGQLMPLHPDTMNIDAIYKVVKEYGLHFNLDTSHIFSKNPHLEPWYEEVYPYMQNIHLSSFKKERDHLPLYLGDLKAKEFAADLAKRKYKGLVTLEIYYPRALRFMNYDYEAMRKSIQVMKN